jgi:hypothetical protein
MNTNKKHTLGYEITWDSQKHTMTIGDYTYEEQTFNSRKYQDRMITDVFGYQLDSIPEEIKAKQITGCIVYKEAIAKAEYMVSQGQRYNFAKLIAKKRWEMIFGAPKQYTIVTNYLNGTQLGYIKAAITNGVTVRVVDMHTGLDTVIDPVYNKHSNILFKKFKVESLNLKDLVAEGNWEMVDYKINSMEVLDAVRHAAMLNIWPVVEESLKAVKDPYYLEKVDNMADFDMLGENYDFVKEIIEQAEDTEYLSATDPLQYVRDTVHTWAPYYDIDIQSGELKVDSDTFMFDFRNTWFTTHNIPYSAESISKRTNVDGRKLRERFYGTDNLEVLLKTYIQIQFYRETNEPGLPEYKLCETCGQPVRIGIEECPHCSAYVAEKLSDQLMLSLINAKDNHYRRAVLKVMIDEGFLTPEDIDKALDYPEVIKAQIENLSK